MSRHYDNRRAAVTVTADDWHPFFDAYFLKALSIFRKYRLPVSTAIVTEWCDAITWKHIQTQLDSGDVEAMAHGRNHLHAPYPNAAHEVTGSKEDIIRNLHLPATFRNGGREYVYVMECLRLCGRDVFLSNSSWRRCVQPPDVVVEIRPNGLARWTTHF